MAFKFVLEMDTVEDLAAVTCIFRDKPVDPEFIRRLTGRLDTSSAVLQADVDAATAR